MGFFLDLMLEKSSIKSSYSNDDVISLSIVNMAKEFNLSCNIVDRK